jgi:hypothetical protein
MNISKKMKNVELSSPYLTLVLHDLYDISGRIRNIEPGYFIVRNHRTGKFEIHSEDNIGDTYCLTLPYSELDARALSYCAERCIGSGGYKRVLDIDKHNKIIDEKKARYFENDLKDASTEMAGSLSLAQEKDDTYEGYKRTHTVLGGLYDGQRRQN